MIFRREYFGEKLYLLIDYYWVPKEPYHLFGRNLLICMDDVNRVTIWQLHYYKAIISTLLNTSEPLSKNRENSYGNFLESDNTTKEWIEY